MARSRRPMSSLVSMSSAAAHLVAGEHRRLAARDDVLGAAHGPGWGRQQDASRHQVVEQLAYCGQVLLDARLSNFGAQLLDICGNRDGLDIIQLEVMILTPVEESFYRARVRHRVAVADGRGKEFDEAAAGALALGADDGRQRFQAGTD